VFADRKLPLAGTSAMVAVMALNGGLVLTWAND
jgi:hypothetical protein